MQFSKLIKYWRAIADRLYDKAMQYMRERRHYEYELYMSEWTCAWENIYWLYNNRSSRSWH